MTTLITKPCSAFEGHRLLLSGPLVDVALAVKAAVEPGSPDTVLVFDDATGKVIDLDLRGGKTEIIERLSGHAQTFVGRYRSGSTETADLEKSGDSSEPRGRGRPKLGVIAREVTLLPTQWEWLASQPGGASAVLRRLVDNARRNGTAHQQRRAAQEAAHHFMQAIAGDLPAYEEATRALFTDDRTKLEQCMAPWPKDIQSYALRLAFGPQDQPTPK